jgi:hypothetical protein
MSHDFGETKLFQRRRSIKKRLSIFLITVALIAGMVACGGGVEYDLTVSSTEGGEVTTPGEETFTYDEGEVVDLVAVADEGYLFDEWIGDVATIADNKNPTTTITMNGDYSITAEFAVKQYDLIISSTVGGEVTAPGEGIFAYDEGTVVNLMAAVKEGYEFGGWTGDVGSIGDINAAATSITVNSDYSITAGFGIGVYDWYDLDAIRENLDGSYVLMNDLDSTTPGYAELASQTVNQGTGWEPIGTSDDQFAGSFYGQGYEIRDLFIDCPDRDSVGLFSVNQGGVVENLGVMNAEVTGHDYVAGLVGCNRGTVSNSYSTGSVTGSENVGGLVGWNKGTMSNCYSTGTVTGSGRVGGLAGANYGGIVDNCYSASNVTGYWQVGGLVGWNQDSIVSNSYSIGCVTGETSVGGLIGYNQWYVTVSNSYYSYDEVLINGQNVITCGALFTEDFAQWLADDKFLNVNERLPQEDGCYLINDVSDFKQLLAFGQDDSLKFRLQNDLDLATEPNFYIPYLAGEFDGNGHKIANLTLKFDSVSAVGLFGYLTPYGRLREVVAENVNITGNDCVGGLVGWNQGIVADSYASGSVTGRNGVGGLAGSGAAGMLRSSYFTGSVVGDWSVGGLVGDHMAGAVSNSHYNYDEVLINGQNIITIGALFNEDFEQWLASDRLLDVNERLSQEDGYYLINDVRDFKQLLAFGQDDSLKFRLKNDLDLATQFNFYIPYLAGEFDGNGHIIRNLTFNCGSASRVGLFGYLASGGRVREMAAENVAIVGQACVGGLVGFSCGTVNNSYSTGSVTGEHEVGGLVGYNDWNAAVTKSYSTVSVTGGSNIGGLLGRNWHATVSDSYSTGSVTGQWEVGGLVGWNKGAIRNCYSSGRVAGVDCVGGLVGKGDADWWGFGWSIQSFWDVEASTTEESDGGTGKTTAEMQDIATFTGWDITPVTAGVTNPAYTWNIVDGQTYPFLNWQSVP